MPKTIQDYIGFKEGDIVTLSDLQTQVEFNKLSVDFPIVEVRSYKEPNGVFAYYGYLIDGGWNHQYMVLVKTMKELFEIYVYYKDVGASGPLYREGRKDPCSLLALFNDAGTDFISRFEASVTNEDQSGTHVVTWDRQTASYGIRFQSTDEPDGMCSLGEYYTADQNSGNNYCLLDWRGDTTKGYIETWYGCPIKTSEIELFHK